jgi:hypothetical protein
MSLETLAAISDDPWRSHGALQRFDGGSGKPRALIMIGVLNATGIMGWGAFL